MSRSRLILTTQLFLPIALFAQGPTRVLSKPDAAYPTAFSAIRGVRELKDGRVIVSDGKDNTIQLVDMKAGTATSIGRAGSGPNEFRFATVLIALGDSTAMFDMGNRRYFLIAGDAKPAGTVPGAENGPDLVSYAPSGDVRGNVYALVRPTPDRLNNFKDSMPIVRYRMSTMKLDTVAMVGSPKLEIVRSTGSAAPGLSLGGAIFAAPFSTQDAWAAFPDGRVAVIRGKDYHIDFYSATGAKTSGRANRFAPIPVTEHEKAEFRALHTPKPGAKGLAAIAQPEPNVWPVTKPPFVTSMAWAGPNGELWIEISRVVGDSAAKFDVFDKSGARRTTITFPAGIKLIGFGAHAAYAVRTDADGLEYLQRYNLGN